MDGFLERVYRSDLQVAATLLLEGGGGGGIGAKLGYPGVLVFESASPFPDSFLPASRLAPYQIISSHLICHLSS